jgi:transketolase|tara:strand:- start:1699 stop:2670 length:972 start_codon:yes stop_codon:yes gene_type:complete
MVKKMSKGRNFTVENQHMSQRDIFWTRVGELMREDEDIVIVTADMGTPVFDKIRTIYPHRFFNVGIAEQNCISVASGLALEGKKPYIFNIATFAILRAFEQIRVGVSIMNLPVTIVGTGTGFSYDDAGPTHHLFEDIAAMRTLPNITINSASDNVMARKLADISREMSTPNYVRLERHINPDIYETNDDFSKGFQVIREGLDGCIISNGFMLWKAFEIADELSKHGKNVSVIDLHTYPCKENNLVQTLEGIPSIITIEENFLPGGMGSYVMELLGDRQIHKNIKRFGVKQEWVYRYGGREHNHEFHGIDTKTLIKETKMFMGV